MPPKPVSAKRPVTRPPRPPLAGILSSVGVLAAILVSLQIYGRIQIRRVLDSGAILHQACALNDHATHGAGGMDQMRLALGPLGPMLQPIVNDTNNVKLKTAYECMQRERVIFEVVLERGPTPISVMVSRREKGETFSRALGADVDTSTSARIYSEQSQGFSVDGFTSGGYIAWIVSGLSRGDNTALARTLAPVVMRYTQAGAR